MSARPQVSINVDSASIVKATVTNNDIKSAAGAEIILNTLAAHTGTFDAKVIGNDIGDAQPGSLDAPADGGSSIWGWAHGDGVTRMEIRNNTVQNWGGRAMELSHNDGIGDADYTVAGNTFSNPDASANTFEGVYILAGGAAGDESDVCVDLEGNDIDGIGRQGGSDIALDPIRRQHPALRRLQRHLGTEPADQPARQEPGEPGADGRDLQRRPNGHHRDRVRRAGRNPVMTRLDRRQTVAEPFLSEIRLMSFNFAPKGWALCNGQLLPINQNQALVLPARHDVRRQRPDELRASRPPRPGADPRRRGFTLGRAGRRAGAHALDRRAADARARR